MPNDGTRPAGSPDPGDTSEMQEQIRAAMVHASVWHRDEYTMAASHAAALCVLALRTDVSVKNIRPLAVGLLAQLPDCRTSCHARADRGPGWKS